VLRQLSYPDRPRPRIDLLYLYDKAKDEAAVRAGIEELFRDFAKNGEVMLALADFAANSGRPALARRIYEYCKANNLPWEGPALMTVEAHVVAKEYREALEACRQMIKDNPEWGKRFYSVFNGLQAIANYGLGDIEAAQLFLNNFLNQAGVRADNLVAVSNRLMTVGAKDQARQVLVQAVKTDPLNQTALVGLIRLDLELGQADTLAASLRTLLTMRKPPRELLQTAYTKLASDRFLFAPGRSTLLDELRVTITSRPTSGPT
jgi:tetratricopeptide (TPR) repeat protein